MGDLGELLKLAAKPKWWQFKKRKLHKQALNYAQPIQNKTNDGGSDGASE